MSTYVMAVSLPDLTLHGAVVSPAFTVWTSEYPTEEDALVGATQLADLYAGHATLTIVEKEHVVAVCQDCGYEIPDGELFWYSDWKCPSEIYCDDCGPRHGYPHAFGEPVEDGWEPTDAFSQYEDPDGSVPDDF